MVSESYGRVDVTSSYSSDWVGHPDGVGGDEESRKLVARRADIQIVDYVTDAEAYYSYDDYCLCRLDDEYYLLNTSGCSCPSPSETWGITLGPLSLPDMRREVVKFIDAQNYGPANRQRQEFIDMLAKAERLARRPPGAAAEGEDG